jgi:hypothetical protein
MLMVGIVVCSDWVSDERIDLACGRRIGDAFDEHTDIEPAAEKDRRRSGANAYCATKSQKEGQVNFLNIPNQTRPQHQI